jgi:hypothetical protein
LPLCIIYDQNMLMMPCIPFLTVFMCPRGSRYLMMLEIEVFMQNHVFCRILDCYSSPGGIELAMASWGSVLSGIARHLASHGEKFRLAEYLAWRNFWPGRIFGHGEIDCTACIVNSFCGQHGLSEARSCSTLLKYETPQFQVPKVQFQTRF